jgi:hypothetical protein
MMVCETMRNQSFHAWCSQVDSKPCDEKVGSIENEDDKEKDRK